MSLKTKPLKGPVFTFLCTFSVHKEMPTKASWNTLFSYFFARIDIFNCRRISTRIYGYETTDNDAYNNGFGADIQVLEGLETVPVWRCISALLVKGLHHLVYEVLDNSIDGTGWLL